MNRRFAIEKWHREVGARRDETEWFYKQAEANECARIVLCQHVGDLLSKIERLEAKIEKLEQRKKS